jgi:hypothetical protein
VRQNSRRVDAPLSVAWAALVWWHYLIPPRFRWFPQVATWEESLKITRGPCGGRASLCKAGDAFYEVEAAENVQIRLH